MQSLDEFYTTQLGRYALAWEQLQFDKLVTDCFGYYALQLGASSVDFLRNSRINNKIIGEESFLPLTQIREGNRSRIGLLYDELPFESESIDLVILPHTLEVAIDPHAVLREVYRVLIPNGRLILTGFNLISLWGMRYQLQKFGAKPFLPGRQFISVFQMKDWLHLLSMSVDRGIFGGYRSTLSVEKMRSDSWIEKAGDRWWPQCGSLYALSAKKVLPGTKFVGKAINKKNFLFGTRANINNLKDRVEE